MTNATILATTLLALVGVVTALCISSNGGVQENFLGMGHSMTHKMVTEVQKPGGGFMTVPGTYQSRLSPRMTNVDYGANIRYNPPSRAMQAGIPTDPLMMGHMAVGKESYSSPPSCGPSGANKGSVYGMSGLRNMPSQNYSAPERKAAESKLQTYEVTSMLPVSTMTELTSSASVQQPVMYDRFMYANQKSRLRQHSDHFRGDLAIAPNKGGWFNVSVNPNIDLNSGALAVMGGVDNSTANKTAGLMSASVGGTQQIFGGVNYGNQMETSLSQGGSTVTVTAFPG